MGKFNFKNYDRKNRNYGNNDLNIDRLSRELIDTPRRSTNYGHRGMQNQDFQQLMLEIAARWAIANKSKRVKLEF